MARSREMGSGLQNSVLAEQGRTIGLAPSSAKTEFCKPDPGRNSVWRQCEVPKDHRQRRQTRETYPQDRGPARAISGWIMRPSYIWHRTCSRDVVNQDVERCRRRCPRRLGPRRERRGCWSSHRRRTGEGPVETNVSIFCRSNQHREAARLAREPKTVTAMLRIYCRAHHGGGKELCAARAELHAY